jgi:hypothetical protein
MLFEKLALHAIAIDVDGTALLVKAHQEGAIIGYSKLSDGILIAQILNAEFGKAKVYSDCENLRKISIKK